MNEGKIYFVLTMLAVISVCITVVFFALWFALWEYHEVIAIATFVVVIGSVALWVLVSLRGKLTEQTLRFERYRYRDEIPLDETGEPLYLPLDAQPNFNRHQRDK